MARDNTVALCLSSPFLSSQQSSHWMKDLLMSFSSLSLGWLLIYVFLLGYYPPPRPVKGKCWRLSNVRVILLATTAPRTSLVLFLFFFPIFKNFCLFYRLDDDHFSTFSHLWTILLSISLLVINYYFEGFVGQFWEEKKEGTSPLKTKKKNNPIDILKLFFSSFFLPRKLSWH